MKLTITSSRPEVLPQDLQQETLYDFVFNRSEENSFPVFITYQFKAIAFEPNGILVWRYEDMTKESGFCGKFYKSEKSVCISN